jgi:hypothetical protein
MRRPVILAAEQHAVIMVVRPELDPFPFEHLDMRLQHSESERIQRQDVLRILRLAISITWPSTTTLGDLDRKRARGQVEPVPASASQLASPHA